jgi:DNA-binding MarR family transcriptional regulator
MIRKVSSKAEMAPSPTRFYQAASYTAEQSVGHLMRRAVSVISQQIETAMEPYGLTNAQWMPLIKLLRGQASTVAELARECQLDAGATTRLLDRLEAKKLVLRTRSLEDRRIVHLSLTSAGRRAAQEVPSVLCDIQNDALSGFSAIEFETLKSLLQRVLDNAVGEERSS